MGHGLPEPTGLASTKTSCYAQEQKLSERLAAYNALLENARSNWRPSQGQRRAHSASTPASSTWSQRQATSPARLLPVPFLTIQQYICWKPKDPVRVQGSSLSTPPRLPLPPKLAHWAAAIKATLGATAQAQDNRESNAIQPLHSLRRALR